MSTARMTDDAQSGVGPETVPSCRPHGVGHGTEKNVPFREFTGKPRLAVYPQVLFFVFACTVLSLWLEARKVGPGDEPK